MGLPLVVVVTVAEVTVECRVDFSVLDSCCCCCLTTDVFFGEGDRAFSVCTLFRGEGDRAFSVGRSVLCGNGDRVSSTDLRVFWGEGDLLIGFPYGFRGEGLLCFLAISVFLTDSTVFSAVALPCCFGYLAGESPRVFCDQQ